MATRFRQEAGSSEGEFRLTLEEIEEPRPDEIPSPDRRPGDNRLTYGDIVVGEINDDMPVQVFRFPARSGDRVNIRMEMVSGTLDPLVILLDPDDNELVRNDDDPLAAGRDSFIHEFVLPDNGIYTIVATRFRQEAGSSEGEFRLILERAGGVPPGAAETGDHDITYGETVRGTISHEMWMQEYTFTAQAGDLVDIQMQNVRGTLDPVIMLLDETDNELARNDDDPLSAGRDAYLRRYRIPADGVYIIVATRFRQEAGQSVGVFRLTLDRAE